MTKIEVRALQQALKKAGFDAGPVDGVLGKRTKQAIIAFKKSKGLRARAFIGPLTRAALFTNDASPVLTKPARGSTAEPKWLMTARRYLGLREYRGNKHNPRIVEWWIKLSLPFRDDETPWCAGFVGGVLEECGIRSTRSAAARSYYWKQWGVVIKEPAVGAVVSMWRGSRRGAYGHVGFVVGKDRFGNLMVLGGNQGNQVSIRPFKMTRVLSYHWPLGQGRPAKIGVDLLPVLRSDGRVSTNEA